LLGRFFDEGFQLSDARKCDDQGETQSETKQIYGNTRVDQKPGVYVDKLSDFLGVIPLRERATGRD
jgi:hypothetical protein